MDRLIFLCVYTSDTCAVSARDNIFFIQKFKNQLTLKAQYNIPSHLNAEQYWLCHSIYPQEGLRLIQVYRKVRYKRQGKKESCWIFIPRWMVIFTENRWNTNVIWKLESREIQLQPVIPLIKNGQIEVNNYLGWDYSFNLYHIKEKHHLRTTGMARFIVNHRHMHFIDKSCF